MTVNAMNAMIVANVLDTLNENKPSKEELTIKNRK